MKRTPIRAAASLLAAGVIALLAIGPAGAETKAAVGAAAQGVTKDQIDIVVLYPDIDALKAKGIQSRSSNEGFLKKFVTYADAFGPINGRKVVVKGITWDPIDATSYDKACTAATQDNKPFVVVNDTGYLTSAIPCIAIDNKTPMAIGDPASETIRKAAGKNLVLLEQPVEATSVTAADIIAKGKVLPKTAKIGILSNNEPSLKASGDSLESALKKKGYNVVSKVEINGLASDLGVISREAAAAADTFQAAGVDTVLLNQSLTSLRPYFQAAERGQMNFKNIAVDTQANMCSPSGSAASQLPQSASGLLCITPWSNKATIDKTKLAPDNAFEAKCRKEYDAATNRKSTPGAYSGGLVVNGVTYEEDFPAVDCNLANVLLPAMKKAGKDLTWDKVYANIQGTTSMQTAYLSNGKAGYGKNKPYATDELHVVELNYANADTPKDANGLFAGCPVPASCWVPTAPNGQEWYPIKTS